MTPGAGHARAGAPLLAPWLLLCAALAGPARADEPAGGAAAKAPAGDPVAVGRQEFDLGEKEFNLGHYEGALAHFEASYRLTARPALLYNLGVVNRRLFDQSRRLSSLEQAIDRLRAFLDTTRGATDARMVAQRARGEQELKDAEAELQREKAARAKGEETLAVGEELLRKGKLDDARKQVDAFEHTPGNERSGVVRALLLRAGILAAQGKGADAVLAYQGALALDRSLEIDKAVVAPPAAALAAAKAFSTAQSKIGGTPALSFVHAAPASTRPGKPLALTFTGSPDPLGLARGVRLHYRSGAGAFSTLPALAPLGAVALPEAFVAGLLPGGRVEYYASVVDRNEAVLEHFGTALLPFVVPVEQPAKNVAKKWWFWTALAGGAGVVAGGALLLNYYYFNPPPYEISNLPPVALGVRGP